MVLYIIVIILIALRRSFSIIFMFFKSYFEVLLVLIDLINYLTCFFYNLFRILLQSIFSIELFVISSSCCKLCDRKVWCKYYCLVEWSFSSRSIWFSYNWYYRSFESFYRFSKRIIRVFIRYQKFEEYIKFLQWLSIIFFNSLVALLLFSLFNLLCVVLYFRYCVFNFL